MLGISLDSTDEWFRYVEWGLLILFGVWAYYLINAHTNFFSGDKKPEDEEDTANIPNIP